MDHIFLMIFVSFMLVLLVFNLFIIFSITRIFTTGAEVNRLTKTLILSLGGLIGARVARNLLKKIL